jgi:2-oxoisovalerate dehydrogenase E1 component
MSVPCATVGSGFLTNDDLVHRFPGRTSQDIVQRTGIVRRARVLAGESPLSMAINAARRALAADRLLVSDLSCIICSTTTPLSTTPSLACRVHAELCREGKRAEMPCFDILAACTGYLYALSSAFDFLQSRPTARVLIVTAEVLSQVTNPDDFDTSPLFGDAASATILYGSALNQPCAAQLHRPLISASGEDGALIHVPAPGNGFVKMDGKKVFADAVRQMIAMLTRACGERQLTVKDLDLIVPHQANARIIEAIRSRLAIPAERVVNRIEDTGNTSSSSIPLCLEHVLAAQPSGSRLGLCAYGGGLTFGAAIMTKS